MVRAWLIFQTSMDKCLKIGRIICRSKLIFVMAKIYCHEDNNNEKLPIVF